MSRLPQNDRYVSPRVDIRSYHPFVQTSYSVRPLFVVEELAHCKLGINRAFVANRDPAATLVISIEDHSSVSGKTPLTGKKQAHLDLKQEDLR